jgi:ATP-dependent Clp protease adaptor protein ClpS
MQRKNQTLRLSAEDILASGPDDNTPPNGTPGTPGAPGDGLERGVATKTREKTKKPSMYRVILMNDDYTPMEFVVSILMGIFKKSQEEATQVMLNVHQTGIGTCGIYTFEVAETKVAQVMDAAKRNQHPLQCTLEKA